MNQPSEKSCDHEKKLRDFRYELERESLYPHWNGDQRYVFKLIKKWFDEAFD